MCKLVNPQNRMAVGVSCVKAGQEMIDHEVLQPYSWFRTMSGSWIELHTLSIMLMHGHTNLHILFSIIHISNCFSFVRACEHQMLSSHVRQSLTKMDQVDEQQRQFLWSIFLETINRGYGRIPPVLFTKQITLISPPYNDTREKILSIKNPKDFKSKKTVLSKTYISLYCSTKN